MNPWADFDADFYVGMLMRGFLWGGAAVVVVGLLLRDLLRFIKKAPSHVD